MTEAAGLTGLGFAWGAAFEDLDLDGHLDLVVAQNYVKWPPHALVKLPGKTLINVPGPAGEPRFVPVDAIPNPWFGQSPVFVDLDGDGAQDVVWLNMDGPVRAYRSEVEANRVHVVLPDDARGLGARVRVEGGGVGYERMHMAGIGLLTDPAPVAVFGIGDRTSVDRVVIDWPDGSRSEIADPPINEPIVAVPPASGPPPSS